MAASPTETGIRKEGWLSKWTNLAYGWQPRWFSIQHEKLRYGHTAEEQVRNVIDLRKHHVGVDLSDKLKFEILNDSGKVLLYLKASSETERDEWHKAILAARNLTAVGPNSSSGAVGSPLVVPVTSNASSVGSRKDCSTITTSKIVAEPQPNNMARAGNNYPDSNQDEDSMLTEMRLREKYDNAWSEVQKAQRQLLQSFDNKQITPEQIKITTINLTKRVGQLKTSVDNLLQNANSKISFEQQRVYALQENLEMVVKDQYRYERASSQKKSC
eukprot:Platyproteum_vivax@DN6135_c0_g1_i2.p1